MLATGAIRFGVLCGGIKRRLPGEMWTPRRLCIREEDADRREVRSKRLPAFLWSVGGMEGFS